MITIAASEKPILEEIAACDNSLLAKRAVIILMSDGSASPENIAKEVELTFQTVKRWQKAFLENRLAIFPKEALHRQPTEAASIEEQSPPSDSPDKPINLSNKEATITKTKTLKDKKPVKYPTRTKIGLEPTATLAEAGRKVLSFHFARMIKYEAGTRRGDDIEALHNMRVAVRRMRAAFRLFGKSYPKKITRPLLQGLKETGRVLGPVRDLDVFMEKLHHYQTSLPAQDDADNLQPMLNLWQGKLEPARQYMLIYLDSKEYLNFKRAFLKFIQKEDGEIYIPSANLPPKPYQLRHVVPKLIYATYAEVRAYEPLLDNAPIDTLHQMRLSFKKLRYTLECFEEVLGEGKQEVIVDIKTMQDHLGNLNDADVASKILQDFLTGWEQHQLHLPLTERKSPAHIMAYLNSQLNERHHLITTFPAAWANFNRPKFRENLAKAIAVL